KHAIIRITPWWHLGGLLQFCGARREETEANLVGHAIRHWLGLQKCVPLNISHAATCGGRCLMKFSEPCDWSIDIRCTKCGKREVLKGVRSSVVMLAQLS